MHLIDSHCHIDFPQFDVDRAEVIQAAKTVGVARLIVPGVKAASWQRQLSLVSHAPGCFSALGLHPYFIDEHQDKHLSLLTELIEQHQPVALGEIGLDYYLAELGREQQLAFFKAQLQLAERYALPVILHVRKAHDEVLKQLRKHKLRGVVHAFSGSQQQAEQYIQLGFKLGFGGAITYERATKLRHIVSNIPLSAIVLESDAPDMAPVSHSGSRNEPKFLVDALSVIAQLRSESESTVAEQTTENVEQMFDLPLRL